MAFSGPLVFVAEATLDANTFTTSAINTTGCDLLVVEIAAYNVVPTFSDSKGNTWAPLTSYDVAGDVLIIGFYALNPIVGTGHTFTITGVNAWQSCVAAGFSGAHLTAPFDQENGASSASATALSTNSVTPGENNELLITGWAVDGALTTAAIDNGFTVIAQVQVGSGVSMAVAVAYKIQTTATPENPQWTGVAATSPMAASIRSFKAAAGAPPPSGILMGQVMT